MIVIHKGYLPGSIGRVVEMHGEYYAASWKFDEFFEAKVATELSEFMIRYNADNDAFWSVVQNRQIEGSLSIDSIHAQEEGAHLRWFVLSDAIRGQGFGNRLMDEAVSFCRDRNYARIYLWTFAGLDAARSLYEKTGFVLTEENEGKQWGTEVIEQKFVMKLS